VTLELVIPGEPVPNARARKGRGGHFYTPAATQAFRERVQAAWMVEGRVKLADRPLLASVEFIHGHSPSNLKKNGAARSGAPEWPRADIDNLVKGVLDALNGLAYKDDSQVVGLVAFQRFAAQGEEPHTVLSLSEWRPRVPVT